ncbi:MAG: hypothetical protein GY882_11270 [Actinomycetia bacterium]|nr:hypothetical protein [Actinomycetes bacterium]
MGMFTEEQILSEHDYARPHVEAGYRLHGGFDANDSYISPRTLGRAEAVADWTEQLTGRGWPLIDADLGMFTSGIYPNTEQQALLVRAGLGRRVWDSMTIIGEFEARGRMLAQAEVPDLADIVVEDISATGLGHLGKGLLKAHGWDEGGDPASGLGAHDLMWFAARDLVFGRGAYPVPPIPESLGRPEADRAMPLVDRPYEALLMLLANVLMIEVNVERLFRSFEDLFAVGDLFADHREGAEKAITLIGRIRQDEYIHVTSVQTLLSEFRSFTVRTTDGREVPGHELFDPAYAAMVHWHTVSDPAQRRRSARAEVVDQLTEVADGDRLLADFDALETP